MIPQCERKTSADIHISHVILFVFWKKIKKKITCCQNNFTFFSFKFESVYLVLGAVHRLRPAASLRPHPQIEDDDRRGDVHSKFGATQFGCQSAHLLPIFYTSLSQSQVNTLLRCKVEMNSKKWWQEIKHSDMKKKKQKIYSDTQHPRDDDVGDE